jgi:hypothetical protein
MPAARSVPLLVASLVAALLLVACGGSGGGGSSDESQIEDAVNRALTSDDPAICTEVATQRFVDVVYGGSLDKCKQDAEDPSDNPDSVDISGISVTGDTAKVSSIKVNGGPNDGQVLAADFKKEGDQWKFDRVTTAAGSGSTTTGAETTATGTTAAGSDPAADLFFKTVHATVIKKGLSEKVAQCIEDKLRGTITPEEIDQIKAGTRPPSLRKKATAAGTECGAKFGA